MELDSDQLTHSGDCIGDTLVEHLLSLDSPDEYNVFGYPEVLPRVGDQYQVEIPLLMTESEYLLYKKNPLEVAFVPSLPCDFLMGLFIPIMWINKEVEYMNHEGQGVLVDLNGTSSETGLLESESSKATKICVKVEDSELKVEPTEEDGIRSEDSTNLALKQEAKKKKHQKLRGEGCCLVPGSVGGSWSDIAEASFLLGLYIFGKSLIQVKRFIDGKTMGDILSFYYGKFYKSHQYRRWSDCRKMRSRRCVYGQRIFTGLRQQELLSRLSLHVSEECQSTLLEVSKTFGEGKMSFEEYVLTLKAIVGLNSLVEAVGIGKGKQDLTGIAVETSKSNHVVPVRPEIPTGKACSSLTSDEIIKFLTGDFRLSKARSSDLFWEAVWPRLLARGWHSEQPRDYYATGSKQALVFLMPGVKKFSRRRLVKGTHYFDSVSDVLSKVASDPSLLELDNETDDNNRNKDDLSDQQRHCYLQARTPNHGRDLMKFTVVDTSLADGKSCKVRELRTLPIEVSKTTSLGSQSKENDEDSSSEVSSEDSDSIDAMLFDQKETDNLKNSKKAVSGISMICDEKDLEICASNQGISSINSYCGNLSIGNFKEFNRKSLKSRQRPIQDDNCLARVTKRHQSLLSCTQPERSHGSLGSSVGPSLEEEEEDKHCCCSETTVSIDNNIYGLASSSQKKFSSSGSSKSSAIENSEDLFCDFKLIDLNLPQIPRDFEIVEVSTIDLRNGQDNQTRAQPENSTTAPKPTADMTGSEQQTNGNSRRQSTRNRPLTVRALEALASGFLTTSSRRRKNKEVGSRDNSSRPQRARGGMVVTESLSSGTGASKMGEVGNGVCNGKSEILVEFQVLSDGNPARASGP